MDTKNETEKIEIQFSKKKFHDENKISNKSRVNNRYATNSHKKYFYYLLGIRLIRADSYFIKEKEINANQRIESKFMKNQNKFRY